MSGGSTRRESSDLTRVLVVGDGQAHERVTEHDHFDPLTERSVDDALARLSRDRVDCVVATSQDGLGTVRRLRAADETLPILLVLAADDAATVADALEADADDVISAGQLGAEATLLATRVRNVVASRRDANGASAGDLQDEAAPREGQRSALFENVGSPVAHVEYVDDTPLILDINPAFAETFGVERPSVVGADIDQIVASDDRREEATTLSERFRDGSTAGVEVVRETADGERPFLLRLAPVDGTETDQLFMTYVNISERKQREEELEQLNERISSLHEAANRLLTAESRSAVYEETVRAAINILEFDWCVTSRPEDGQLALTAASEETPFEVGDAPLAVGEGISGRAFETGETDLTNDMLADPVGEPANDAIRSGLTVPIGEFGIFQAVSTEPDAFDEIDKELAELLVAHTQEALYWFERTDELERQNERLDQFASAVSHDLRNPLTIARGRLELVRKTEELSHLEAADRALDRMNSIIDDVLALAREAPSADPEPVALETAAETAWSMVDTGGASVVVDAEGERLADPERLQRLFENVFRNSIEHGDADTVRVEETEGGFAVVDDGTGFGDAANVFETGESTNGGTGLGLAIVQRIAEAHDWTVTAGDSADGARIEIRGVEDAESAS